VEAPLLRAGLTIETECSEKYLVKVTEKLMESIRVINNPSENNPPQTLNS
jgi:hypothetical protein